MISIEEIITALSGFKYIIMFVVIMIGTFFFARIVRSVFNKNILLEHKKLKIDQTHYTFLKHLISASIYILGFIVAIYMIPSLRTLSVSLLAGAGIFAVVVGFASQAAFSNIVSGIFIAIFKPFRVGDTIKLGTGIGGTIEDITLRHTVIKNYENRRIIVPNTVISNEIIENSSLVDEKICKHFEIGISYDSDINKAMKIIQREAQKHPDFLDERTKEDKKNKEPAVRVRVVGFGDSSVNLKAWIWTKNPASSFRLGTDLNKSVKEAFDKSGIEIPFPYRTIVYKEAKKKGKKKTARVNTRSKKK